MSACAPDQRSALRPYHLGVELDVLGAVRVRHDGAEIDLGTPRQCAIMAALALSGDRPVPAETLVARIWGTNAPPTVTGTLQSYIGQLRRALEPDRGPRRPAQLLVTRRDGYALQIPAAARDDVRLAQTVAAARQSLVVVPDMLRPTVPAELMPQVQRTRAELEEALSWWRGEPYGELGEDPDAAAERGRLRDLHGTAMELAAVAGLCLGRHEETTTHLAALVQAHPLRERGWGLWAVALARGGRQSEALAVLQRLRSTLDDELGVEPSPPLRALHTAILRQDGTVAWQPAEPTVASGAPRVRLPEVPGLFPRAPHPGPELGLVGRVDELRRLQACLTAAVAGRPQAVYVTGEAGIGKSRLLEELARVATERGFAVASVTCGEPGAPALWPWRRLMAAIGGWAGSAGERAVEQETGSEFARAGIVVAGLRDSARRQPLLVVLEDVHEADAASLAVLCRLVAQLDQDRLVVVASRRTGAGAEGELARVAVTMARAAGERLDLEGLSPVEASELLVAADATRPREEDAALIVRAGGNPFFLLQLQRTGGAVTGSLRDVVAARLEALPAATLTALRVSALAGPDAEIALVALALGRSVGELEDVLEPAIQSGLVQRLVPGPEPRVSFAHAVVREVVADSVATGEHRTWHHRLATELDGHSGLRGPARRAALARHRLCAGADYAAEGWRSLVGAAGQAAAAACHAEAASLYERALSLMELDRGSDAQQRHEVLMLLIDAQRWSGQWAELSVNVDRAIATAEELGDSELIARSAIATIEGAVWQVRVFGVVHAPVVAALERAVSQLDARSGPLGLRARARVALATELYYGGDVARIDRLVAEALDLSGSTDDPRLTWLVLTGAFSACWRTETLDQRREWADRAAECALELGDARAQALAQTLQVCAALERGDTGAVRRLLPGTLALARHLGLLTAESVLLAIEVPLQAMAGDDAAASAALSAAWTLVRSSSRVPNYDRAVLGTAALAAFWAGDATARTDPPDSTGASDPGIAMDHLSPWLRLRSGSPVPAGDGDPAPGIDLSTHTYLALINACLACELGLGLGQPQVAERGYGYARQYAGRMASGGSAMALGPVDGFLAMGAAAAGDLDSARRHAEAAATLGRDWGLPRYVDWLHGVRRRYGF